jgi:hypothetical protein
VSRERDTVTSFTLSSPATHTKELAAGLWRTTAFPAGVEMMPEAAGRSGSWARISGSPTRRTSARWRMDSTRRWERAEVSIRCPFRRVPGKVTAGEAPVFPI